MPSRFAHRRDMTTTQPIKTESQSHLLFNLKNVPMPSLPTFFRRLSRDRLFTKKQKSKFATNFSSRSCISASTLSPNGSQVFSYGRDRRPFSQYSTHASESSSSSSSSPQPSPPPQPRFDVYKEIRNVSGLHAVAVDEMSYAEESKDSFYYREDYQTARKAVEECVASYESLLTLLLFDTDHELVQQLIGLKVQELQANFNALPPIPDRV